MSCIIEHPQRVQHVSVATDSVQLEGNLVIPEGAQGIVLCAHSSGSSRHSSRKRYVAQILESAGLATLLLDLLTANEAAMDRRVGHLCFDIDLLATRLMGVTDWLAQNLDTKPLNIGYLGASTGAGAAFIAAANRPALVKAIVSRGGRPDLAGPALGLVQAPTLLLVGGRDDAILEINRIALAKIISTAKQLKVIPGATHLFREPEALQKVAQLASDWLRRYLTAT